MERKSNFLSSSFVLFWGGKECFTKIFKYHYEVTLIMEISLDTLKVFRRNSLSRQLATRRANYQRQYGELAVGIQLLPHFQQMYDFEALGWEPINHYEKMVELLEKEIPEEIQWRKEAVRQYIKDAGLEKHTDEIIGGMNKSDQRVTMWQDSEASELGNVLRARQVLLHDSKALINFALDYVDRWQMYNELFSDVSK